MGPHPYDPLPLAEVRPRFAGFEEEVHPAGWPLHRSVAVREPALAAYGLLQAAECPVEASEIAGSRSGNSYQMNFPRGHSVSNVLYERRTSPPPILSLPLPRIDSRSEPTDTIVPRSSRVEARSRARGAPRPSAQSAAGRLLPLETELEAGQPFLPCHGARLEEAGAACDPAALPPFSHLPLRRSPHCRAAC